MSNINDLEAKEDFSRARFKGTLNKLVGILKNQKQELLSFEAVKNLIQPTAQRFVGMKPIEVKKIVGSEGRYHDFDRSFLPKHDYLKDRWTRVDLAVYDSVTLPPIKVFELGGVYFVRDGNHRVSVARMQGIDMIDAEIVSLSSDIKISPDASFEDLRASIIEFEKNTFLQETKYDKILPGVPLEFTNTGMYEEVLSHIEVHKYFVNQTYKEELPYFYSLISWYETVYQPIVDIIRRERIGDKFPGRTESDLYVWIVKHWHFLKERYGNSISPNEAVVSYTTMFGQNFLQRVKRFFTKGRKKQ